MTGSADGRRWEWEHANVNTVSLSGDVSKLFRNEPIDQPGVFERDAPTSQARRSGTPCLRASRALAIVTRT